TRGDRGGRCRSRRPPGAALRARLSARCRLGRIGGMRRGAAALPGADGAQRRTVPRLAVRGGAGAVIPAATLLARGAGGALVAAALLGLLDAAGAGRRRQTPT